MIWEGEEDIIKTCQKDKLPIRIVSEEHGRINLGDEFLGILDGLDGSDMYKALMQGDVPIARYGTMFAIFDF